MISSKNLIMKDICESGATREAGRVARRKAQEWLNHEEALVLDFRDFKITPSFADEFAGKLAGELGGRRFRQVITAENLTPATRSLLNHAVRRRLEERLSA